MQVLFSLSERSRSRPGPSGIRSQANFVSSLPPSLQRWLGRVIADTVVQMIGAQNDWAPVHRSIAGPVVLAHGEGCLVHTSCLSRSEAAWPLRSGLANMF